jgi:hypothetical protein
MLWQSRSRSISEIKSPDIGGDGKRDEVATAKLTVDCQVEHGKIAQTLSHLKTNADRPDFPKFTVIFSLLCVVRREKVRDQFLRFTLTFLVGSKLLGRHVSRVHDETLASEFAQGKALSLALIRKLVGFVSLDSQRILTLKPPVSALST